MWKVHAIDLDFGENGEVRYELIRGHGELFKVCRKTGEISLRQTLESHKKDFQLVIAAYDGGMTPCSTEVLVHVTVIDRDMPIFEKEFYSLKVPENFPIHTPLPIGIKVHSPHGKKIFYSISSGDDFEKFDISYNTGIISIVDELDFETSQQFYLTIKATDVLTGAFSEVYLQVEVLDINDCYPHFPVNLYNTSLLEAAPVGTLVLTVAATDNDTGLNGEVHYSIHGSSADDNFSINSKSGEIYLKKSLDRELKDLHIISIIAADFGVPNLTTSINVWITVLDLNDNPPRFDKDSYSMWLSNEAKRNQIVGVVSATDKDIGHLQYGFNSGNQHHTFSINSATGVITVINTHKLKDKHTHVVNVSVSDGVHTSYCRVNVKIVPNNHNSPKFEKHQYDVLLSENVPIGTSVIKVKATDPDLDGYTNLFYSIPSEELLELFYINNITGEVRTKKILDREIVSVYDIPVLVQDVGGKTGITTIRLVINDINDNPPQFQLQEYKSCIFSNLTINSAFLKVKAQDKDDGVSAKIEYSIYNEELSNIEELFAINQNTGSLILLQSVLEYENQIFQFFVRGSDSGKPTLYSDVSVEIYIMSYLDDPPVFQRSDQEIFVPEDVQIGTVITQVELVSKISVSYSLVSRDNNFFDIDSDGQIRVTKTLDREKTSFFYLGVLAQTDTSPPLTALSEISLHILDLNDNPPKFSSEKYSTVISEDIMEGSSVVKVYASDLDESVNGEIHYSILEGDGSYAIDAYTGWITTVKGLDREVKATYNLSVVAKDNGSPALTSMSLVHITISDCNDNPPNFSQETYYVTVLEDAPLGYIIISLTVTDLDNEGTNYINYFISDGNPFSQFGISQTGEIYNAQKLDRERMDKYHLTVIATDSKFVTSTLVAIEILDVNDEKPQCTQVRYSEVIPENLPPGTLIFTVLATDADLKSNIKFVLTGEGAHNFYLDQVTGEFRTGHFLDREQISRYSLTAHVQDGDIPDWECLCYINIDLSDVNDNPPTFYANYTVTLAEDAVVGTLVTKLHAYDLDQGLNRKILYTLVDSGNDHFEISGNTGIVRLTKPMDREAKSVYLLIAKAMDQGNPQLWSTTTLRILILDINDNPPEFISQTYYVNVAENVTLNSDITRVMATSLDSGVNAQITYSIIEGNELQKFRIHSETGVIQVCEPLDFEELQSFILTVVATDLGEPPLSNTAIVNITIIDSNDNTPIFSEPTYQTDVGEDIRIGDLVIQVTASDIDSGNNGKVSYYLKSGDKHQQFNLDYNTGVITVARPLDREMIPRYNLHIIASDNGEPPSSASTTVQVNVMDTNDNPPLFSQLNYTAIIQENKEPGWPVCELTVTDADIFPNADPFSLQIISGDPEGKFKIGSGGILQTTAMLSCKIQDIYLLHIRAFDSGTPHLYSDTWISIKIVEESKFTPVAKPLEIWMVMYEEHWTGGEIGRVKATDEDPYDSLTFSILESKFGNLFSIDSRHGSLTVSPKLDAGSYTLNISVTDGKFVTYTKVSVYVQPIYNEILQHSISIRLANITPHEFVWKRWKDVQVNIKSSLQQDVHLISVQAAPHGDLDVLIAVKGGIDQMALSNALEKDGFNKIIFSCGCKNGAICRQRIQLQPEMIYNVATETKNFVAVGHSHELYCACNLGFAGDHCEELLPPAECVCPAPQICVPQQTPPGYLCLPSLACLSNRTCNQFVTSSSYSITSDEVVGIFVAISAIVFLIIIFILYKCRKRDERIAGFNKSPSVLNPSIKRTSKLSNLELSQRPSRPSSYTNNEVLTITPLNNLDSLRTYGSIGDDLEHVPPDYRRNLNRNATSPHNKINNDLKRVPEYSQQSLNSTEDESRIIGGYHWDCSDWVRPGQNPLPNITEVLSNEIADSSSYHSNTSNETNSQINESVDPARHLETLDKKLYLRYNSEDNVIVYGFPSQPQPLTVVESDVPS
uniref:Cadherin domain-containing protein n=1 Tax=Clastoptera arizonana TaxID=38151 RepID=A0A1B6CQG5_9HEMI